MQSKIRNLCFLYIITCFFLACKKKESIVAIESKRIQIDTTTKGSSSINDFISPYKTHINTTLDSVLAFSPKTYRKSDGILNTAIGNLMADLVLEQSNPIFEARTKNKIDMVLLNQGGIRSPIQKGNVTARTAYEVMPFENSIIVVEMTGTQLQPLLAFLCEAKKAHPISGLQLTLDSNYRIQQALINSKEINKETIYYVATNDYLYNGGSEMYFFKQAGQAHHLNYKIRNAMIDYFKKKDTIAPIVDDRFMQIN